MQEPSKIQQGVAPKVAQGVQPVPPEVVRAIQDQLELRRSEIREQLGELSKRRNELQQNRAVASSQPQAREIDARIAVIDQRSAQLESQLFAVNDQIARSISPELIASAKVVRAGQSVPVGDPGLLLRQVRDAAGDAVAANFWGSAFGLLAVVVVWKGFRRFIWKPKRSAIADNSAQLVQLQQSMDVIALEVERISEAHRYTAKLLNERGIGAGDAARDPVGGRRP